MSPVTTRPDVGRPDVARPDIGRSAAVTPVARPSAMSSASSTLCCGCARRVEHRSNYAIATVQTQTPEGVRTKLVANGTLVIHACVAEPDATNAE